MTLCCSRFTPDVSRIMIKKPGPGDPAAHRLACLPLLPSGPGGVHKILLHRAQPLSLVSPSRPIRLADVRVFRRSYFAFRFFTRYERRDARDGFLCGGEDGIRTHGTVAGTRAFQARRIGHSRTSPTFVQLAPFEADQDAFSLFFSKVRHLITGPSGPQGSLFLL